MHRTFSIVDGSATLVLGLSLSYFSGSVWIILCDTMACQWECWDLNLGLIRSWTLLGYGLWIWPAVSLGTGMFGYGFMHTHPSGSVGVTLFLLTSSNHFHHILLSQSFPTHLLSPQTDEY